MKKINNIQILLIIIVVLATILRVVAALHTDVGTDELPHAVRAIDIISAGRLSSLDQVPLYLYLTDVAYQIFGVNGLSARFTNILFGALATLLIFLIGKELFNKKIGLISSFLFSISGYSIVFNIEPDMPGVFFMLFSIYFYIKGLKYHHKFFLHSAFFLGLGVLAKNIAAFILPVYVIFYFIYSTKFHQKPLLDLKRRKLNFNKSFLITILACAIIIIVVVSPILTFNYLLYKDKGITDLIVARSLDIDTDLYNNFFGGLRDWSFSLDYAVTKQVVRKIFLNDWAISLLSILGLIFLFTKRNVWKWFLLLSVIIPFIVLTGSAGASKTHFLFTMPFLTIFAALAIYSIGKQFNSKQVIWFILGAVLLLNLFIMKDELTSTSGMIGLRAAAQEFEENSLVVADSRIWNGRIAWTLNDKHYLESNNLPSLLNNLEQFPGPMVNIPTYFVECVRDDCGWGRGLLENEAAQQLGESVVQFFEQNGKLIKTIPGEKFTFNIYKADLPLKDSLFPTVDQTHNFFLNSVRWKNKEAMPDYYVTHNLFDKLLDWLSHLVLYLAVLAALLSPIYLYRLVKKESG